MKKGQAMPDPEINLLSTVPVHPWSRERRILFM
jgi:hypothetical protein